MRFDRIRMKALLPVRLPKDTQIARDAGSEKRQKTLHDIN